MSGDVQTRRRKDKRRKKEGGSLGSIHDQVSSHKFSKNEEDHKIYDLPDKGEKIHVQNEHGIGGNICVKIIFFCLFGLLIGAVGLIYLQSQGSTDVDLPTNEESRFAEYFTGWLDDNVDDHHDEHLKESVDADHEDNEEQDEHDDHEQDEHDDHEQDEHENEENESSEQGSIIYNLFGHRDEPDHVEESEEVEPERVTETKHSEALQNVDKDEESDENEKTEDSEEDEKDEEYNASGKNKDEDDENEDNEDEDNEDEEDEDFRYIKRSYRSKKRIVVKYNRNDEDESNADEDNDDDDDENEDDNKNNDDDEEDEDLSQVDEEDMSQGEEEILPINFIKSKIESKKDRTVFEDEENEEDDNEDEDEDENDSNDTNDNEKEESNEVDDKKKFEDSEEKDIKERSDELSVEESIISEEDLEKPTNDDDDDDDDVVVDDDKERDKIVKAFTEKVSSEQSPEEDAEEPDSGGVALKLGVGIALIIVAHLVLVKKWNSMSKTESDENGADGIKTAQESKKGESVDSSTEPAVFRRQTLIPESACFDEESEIEDEDEYEYENEENEEIKNEVYVKDKIVDDVFAKSNKKNWETLEKPQFFNENNGDLVDNENSYEIIKKEYEDIGEDEEEDNEEEMDEEELEEEEEDEEVKNKEEVEDEDVEEEEEEEEEEVEEDEDEGEVEEEEGEDEDDDVEDEEEEEELEEEDDIVKIADEPEDEEEEEEEKNDNVEETKNILKQKSPSVAVKEIEEEPPTPPPRTRAGRGAQEFDEESITQYEEHTDANDNHPTENEKPPENKAGNEDEWAFEKELNFAEEQLENNPKASVKAFESIISKKPNMIRALIGRAKALDQLAEKEKSNAYLKQAIEAYKTVILNHEHSLDDDTYVKLAERCIERMRFAGALVSAIQIHKALILKYPNTPKYRNTLAVTYLMLNKIPQAKVLLNETLSLWPTDGFALVHYGFILKTSDNDMEEGAKKLMAGIKTGHKGVIDGTFFFHLGDALNRLGRTKEAMEWYELGVEKGLFLSKYQRSLYNVNRLKGQPWWSKEETTYKDFFKKLEENWREIRREGLELLNSKGVNLFKEEAENLKDTGDWRQLDLYFRGRKQGNCNKAPITCSLVSSFKPASTCTRGQIKFSVMLPKTHVWPHCGPTNCRLRSHLGLVVPKNTYIRVAEETRSWEEGKFIIFDDSFEHEVWHNGTGLRLVLIVDVWHPELTLEERRYLSPI